MPNNLTSSVQDQLAKMRIAAGGVRERLSLSVQRARARPRIAASAATAIERLAELKRTHSAGRPMVGIFLAEHFGDIVAAEPVIGHLRQSLPDAFFVWFAKAAYSELVETHPQLDAVIAVNSILETPFIAESGLLSRTVDLHVEGKHCARYDLSYRRRSGNRSVNAQTYYHRGALLEALSISAGLNKLDEQPKLHLSAGISASVDALQLPPNYIVLHGLSNEAIRNWDRAKWLALSGALSKFGLSIVEIGLEPVLPGGATGLINLCGKLSVSQSAEVIRRADLFIGIDSGPAHCANAFERPAVILLGKYLHFGDYMPYTGHLRKHQDLMILRSPGSCSEIQVDAVMARVERLISSRAAKAESAKSGSPFPTVGC